MGRRLRIGAAEMRVRGETVPCDRMDLQRAGLQEALRLDMRGGVFGPVERSGPIRLGDPVVVLEEKGAGLSSPTQPPLIGLTFFGKLGILGRMEAMTEGTAPTTPVTGTRDRHSTAAPPG